MHIGSNYDYYTLALTHYSHLFNQDPAVYRPSVARLYHNLGVNAKQRQDYENAEHYYIESLNHRTILYNERPKSFRRDLALTQRALAELYMCISDYTKAEYYFSEAIDNYYNLYEASPNIYSVSLSGTLRSMSSLCSRIHKYELAIEYADKAISIQPDNPKNYELKGLVLIKMGDISKAAKMWTKVLSLDPLFVKNVGGYSELEYLLKSNGLLNDAQ